MIGNKQIQIFESNGNFINSINNIEAYGISINQQTNQISFL